MQKVGDIGGFGGSPGQGGITVQDLVRAGLINEGSIGPGGTILGSDAVRLGGFLMGADYVRDLANSFGLASTVAAGDDVRFWAGATFANRATAPFRLTEAGALVATSATITGAITATSGAIGGFDVGSDYVRDAANSFGLASTVTGGDDVRFWAGSTFANRATAPFRVTEAGVMTATSGTFSGTLSAITGTIGGFDIGTEYIRDSANTFGLASTTTGGADVRFWCGDTFANRASAPVRLYDNNSLYVYSIEVGTGSITTNVSGSSGSCTGNAASATVLQTARNIGGVSFNGSGDITPTNCVQLNNSGHTYTFSGGSSAGSATATFSSTTKPGSSTSSTWLSFVIDGGTYYIPIWT